MENVEARQPQEDVMELPMEYVLEGMKGALDAMHRMLRKAKTEYGSRYNWKNDYEELLRRYKCEDADTILKEYDLMREKKSKQPAIIRRVIQQLGDNAIRHAYRRQLAEQSSPQNEQPQKH